MHGRKNTEFVLYPIAKAMSSLRQVGTAALSRPRCLLGVWTLEGTRPYPCGHSFFETVLALAHFGLVLGLLRYDSSLP